MTHLGECSFCLAEVQLARTDRVLSDTWVASERNLILTKLGFYRMFVRGEPGVAERTPW